MEHTDEEAEAYLRRHIDQLPNRVRHAVIWLRRPEARWLRIPAGIFLVCGGFVWFLPMVGLWMLPLGLLLLAEDIPPMKRRIASTLSRVERWSRRSDG